MICISPTQTCTSKLQLSWRARKRVAPVSISNGSDCI